MSQKPTAEPALKLVEEQCRESRPLGSAGGKYLTFFLAGEEYGVEILKVREIIGMMPITPVPGTPDYVKGVINLRGRVIPTVDLRLKFGMQPKKPTRETCIIVITANGIEMGVIVDNVSEALSIASEDIEDTPAFGAAVDSDYILGIGKHEGKVRLLVDIDKALSSQDARGSSNGEDSK